MKTFHEIRPKRALDQTLALQVIKVKVVPFNMSLKVEVAREWKYQRVKCNYKSSAVVHFCQVLQPEFSKTARIKK